MNYKTKNGIIIFLIIVVVILLCIIFYLMTRPSTLPKEEINNINDVEKNDKNIESEQNKEDNRQFKNFDYENIKNIEIATLCKECDEPKYDYASIESEKDINYILESLDEVEFIKNIPEGAGFDGLMSISVNYNGEPSTLIYFLDNGNLAINYAEGAGETGYAEYKLNDREFKNNLIDKYIYNLEQ